MIPQDVLAQLNAHKDFGLWLASKYPEQQRDQWWSEWLLSTPVGRAHAETIQRRSTRIKEGLRQLAVAEQEQREQEQQRRIDHENRWRREPGDAVVIKSPQTTMHGMVGRVQRMEWIEENYFVYILVDPVPTTHPLHMRDIKYRPSGAMPMLYKLKADEVSQVELRAGNS